jgi:6-phosphofructokinase 1
MPPTPSNLLVLQGGGPTPVLNTSLYAVLDESRRSGAISKILAARHGIEGLVRSDLIDLTHLPDSDLQRLKRTPGATLGTTRYKPTDNELEQVITTLKKHEIRHLILIGGNGSLIGAHVINHAAQRQNYDLRVIGCPKTIDNDIPHTDRCPGFGSAANYLAQSVRDLGLDVRALPQPVSIYETMGRSVGWLAAAAALARDPADDASAPHLIYLPELPFDPDRFLASVDRVVTRHKHCIVVVAEGLRKPDGSPLYQSTAATQTDALGRALPGGVATHLADHVTTHLKIRCRSEKPGLCGRASIHHLSPQDALDADHVGRAAVQACLADQTGQWPSLLPLSTQHSAPSTTLLPLPTTSSERPLPPDFLSPQADLPVTDAFLRYARACAGPLIDYPKPLKDQPPTHAGAERSNADRRSAAPDSSRPKKDLS